MAMTIGSRDRSGWRIAAFGIAAFWLAALLAGCDNSPYAKGANATNTLFYSFDERSPRYLDPTASYTNPEAAYTYQVYEPLYGYHYLKRPYTLIPKAATEVVKPYYLDANGQRLPDDVAVEKIAESVYDIPIRRNVMYAPHPAFVKDAQGNYLYHHLTPAQLAGKRSPWDFEQQGTRELVADDFVYALKRHATTRIEAPVYAVFAEYVLGLKEYGPMIKAEDAKLLKGLPSDIHDKPFLDFRKWPLAGAVAVDPHLLRIRLKGKYPQWSYWMAMPFMAPVPWEADAFYAQTGMTDNGMSLNQWPVGTGPYMMTEFIRDRRHVMKRNPNFRGEPYPCEGSPGDKEAGLLADCGKRMPFIDELYVTIEKERVPRKEKFKQGFLDVPELERPDWGVEFRYDANNSDEVQKVFDERGFKFPFTTDISNWYLGFNMLDPVIGAGKTPAEDVKHRKLRQAISIAIDWDEGYSRIFQNKGGVPAHSPLPPGLFGSREGQGTFHDPVTHKIVDGKVVHRSIDEAKKLLAEAGYPDGRDAVTGQPLVLNYDFNKTPTPELKTENDWMVRQFAKIGIQLEVRATDFNQFQDKTLKGKHQVYWFGWLADYPDAENFLFLFYGPNAKSKTNGENTSNYENKAYDALYVKLKTLDDGPEKQAVIDEMVTTLQNDAVWSFGYFPWAGSAFQQWVYNGKPSIITQDRAKYYRVDPALRVAKQAEWNKQTWWPMLVFVAMFVLVGWIGARSYRARQRATAAPAPALAPAALMPRPAT